MAFGSADNKNLALNLPPAELRINFKEGKPFVFSTMKKKFLVLTPEEWVRQNLLQFLVSEKGYKIGLAVCEKGIKVNGLAKRIDILFNDLHGNPLLLIECKAPHIAITEETAHQALTYNKQINAPHILLSNGMQHLWITKPTTVKWTNFTDIPTMASLIS
ncbi:MAG: type I restriction enzyme HsdR N-terminal domain-containing protein [Luteibaculaceae bacterium]